MTTINSKIKAWLSNPAQITKLGTDNPPSITYTDSDMTDCGWVLLGEAAVELTLSPMSELVASAEGALRMAIQKVQADTYVKVTALEGMIANLLCLEMSPAPIPAPEPAVDFNIDDDISF